LAQQPAEPQGFAELLFLGELGILISIGPPPNERPVMKFQFSVVAVLAVTLGSALSQQSTDPGPGQIRTDIIVDLVTNPSIREELRISEGVAAKLMSLREDFRAAVQKAYQDAGVNPADYPVRMTTEQQRMYQEIPLKLHSEFGPKAKELLTPDQNRRLLQIQFQGKLRNSVPSALLRPRPVPELKLTDEQKQKLNALGMELVRGGPITSKVAEEHAVKAMEVLTAEQKETLMELQGESFDLTRLVPRTPRTPRAPRIAPPGKGN